jgi:hypothetical protein
VATRGAPRGGSAARACAPALPRVRVSPVGWEPLPTGHVPDPLPRAGGARTRALTRGLAAACQRLPRGVHVHVVRLMWVPLLTSSSLYICLFHIFCIQTLKYANNISVSIILTSLSQWSNPSWHLRLFVIMSYFTL